MLEAEFTRVATIDRLLRAKDYDALEQLTHEQMPLQLLGEDALNAARLMKLPATVIYLASLAVENRRNLRQSQVWLAVYQSLARSAPSPEFTAISPKHPLRLVATALMQASDLEPAALRKCPGALDDWFHAVELAIDHKGFGLVDQLVRELVRRKLDVVDWLRLTKLLFNRHSFIGQAQNIEALGLSYARIRNHLISPLPAVRKVRSRLALFASLCHFVSGNYPAAVLAAKGATASDDLIHAAFDTARAHCHAGELPETIASLDELVALMCAADTAASLNEDILATQDAVAAAEQQQRVFDPGQASQALVDLQAALSAVGKRAFLVSGTLLGYAREGQILAHDKDIDVGIIGWEDQYEVANALLQSGHFGIDSRRLRGRKAYHIPVMHQATRVAIDIFIYHPENGMWVTGVESYFGYLQKFAFTPFELKAVSFLGIDFYVPGDVEKNLAENFGDWRQSDPEYISHLQSPSTVDVGGLVYQIVGRLRALEAIQAKKYEKLNRVIQLMERHQDRPGGMRADTLDLLKGVLDAHQPAEVA
ncbi:MAG: hypothetical protein IV088_13275 [Hydrogenophaga sp.]|uniref:hypothetical protein n=1 Tax=Hydrogenophaga sp. TaxID=1904254 RepID=UPI0025BDDA8E|nr:hypothetical protein [Hydrogenophaga sp.]MBT9551818.1 hypothetical protein [Hydrogenophaga sp.]